MMVLLEGFMESMNAVVYGKKEGSGSGQEVVSAVPEGEPADGKH